MKKCKRSLALTLVLILALAMAVPAAAANEGGAGGFGGLPAGTYTYVSGTPAAEKGSGVGEVRFDYLNDTLAWAFGGDGGVTTGRAVLTGDELEFFRGLYISDRPLYDWLASEPRDTEGYEGNVADNFLITFTGDGKISRLRVDDGTTNAVAILTKDITADTLTVSGETRGQPNLLQSSITLFGSTNGLHLTDRGNVVLNAITIGHNAEGVGLKSDKIGGDTFIVDTVLVDGKVEWFSRYANIQPVKFDVPATLMTNGQDMIITGANVGRMGKPLNFSTGEGGGDIIIGATVSTDYGRRDPLPDPSVGTLVLSTTGDITAGQGDVVIGTNTERIVNIDVIGNIQGANVTIKPTGNGAVTAVSSSIGNITAAGSIDVTLGTVNAGNAETNVIGDLTAENGDITVVTGELTGSIGNVTAEKGKVDLKIESASGTGTVSGAEVVKDVGAPSAANRVYAAPMTATVTVNGQAVAFEAYHINGSNYFRLRDVAYALADTNKQFEVNWYGTADATVTLTSGRAYTPVGGEMTGKAEGVKAAMPTTSKAYLDSKQIFLTEYKIDGEIYFKLRDLGEALDFGVDWDGAANTICIDTSKGYTA